MVFRHMDFGVVLQTDPPVRRVHDDPKGTLDAYGNEIIPTLGG